MDAPDLVIPMRFDVDKALQGLGKLGPAGDKAGAAVAAGAAKAGKGLQVTKASADSLGSSLTGLLKAQIGLSAMRQTASAIGAAFNDTAKYVQESAKQFAELRKTMQEVATLKGEANSNKFTLQEAEKAQKAHLTPQEYRDFQAEFMNFAGAQIGEDENGKLAKGAKLTTKQGEEYAARVAEMMKASGVNPAVGAELAGSLLENAKGPQDVDALMEKFSKTFNILEKGRVPLKQALPQMSRIMAHDIEAEDAAQMFNIVAPVSPGEEATSVEAAIKSIQKMKNTGKGEEFGVRKGMGDMEAAKAFAENIDQRKQNLMASGKTDKEASDELEAMLAEKDLVADTREARGLIRGFGHQGVELGGFGRFKKIADETPADFEAARKKRYEESEQGRDDAVANAKAVETAKMGERNAPVARWREIAETELIAGGGFEKPNLAAEAAAQLPGASSKKDILINQQSIRRARAMLGESTDSAGDTAASVNQGLTDALLRELLKRLESIDLETRKANAQRVGVGAPPLAAPQPGGAGARQ
jgi:hypothetical protein